VMTRLGSRPGVDLLLYTAEQTPTVRAALEQIGRELKGRFAILDAGIPGSLSYVRSEYRLSVETLLFDKPLENIIRMSGVRFRVERLAAAASYLLEKARFAIAFAQAA